MRDTIQPSFAAGEVSPALYQRIDLQKWHIGAKTMLNWYVHAQGGASNRPGTAWVGELLDSTKLGRLIPFQYSTIQTYVLEFGDYKMRVIKDGAYVTESTKTISAITKANPGKVTTSTTHGYSTGDRVYLSTDIGGMTELRGRYVDITVTSATEFTIGIDTTSFTTYTSGGTTAKLYTVTSPYAYSDLGTLKYEQSADTMTLTHKSYSAYKLTRSSHTSWTFTAITFAPTQPAPTGISSSAGGSTYYYAITAVNDDTGEESLQSADVGSSTQTSTLTWASLTGCSTYNVYKKKDGVYGFIGTAQGVAGSGNVTFTDATITPDKTTTPPQQRNPFGYGTASGVTITAAGSGYSSPSGVLYDGGVALTTVTIGVTAGAITSATLANTNKRASPNAYITISDGAGAGASLQINWDAPTYNSSTGYFESGIDSITVLSGGASYHSGVVVRLLDSGTPYDPGYTFTPTVAAGAITAVAVGGTLARFNVDVLSYLSLSVTDSTGSGGVLTPTITAVSTQSPGCSGYHDGRLWFAGSASSPQTMWGSVSGAFNSMAQSQPTRDSDAITRTLASKQVNDIKHIVSLTQMIVLTGGSEWKVSAGSGDVITPSQFVARPQSYNGSSDVRPIVANNALLYLNPANKKVRNLQYDWGSDTWGGSDLSLLSAHLFEQYTVTNWAFARDPESIIWAVRSDGTLLGFTFMPEQQVFAWHRHTTTGGTFEDVCCIQEGSETAVYFIVNRTINGSTKRYVERLHTRVFSTISAAWFLDAAAQYSGSAATTISGLWHLVGESVYALADGIVRGPYTVTAGGQITLSVAASTVTVGKIIPDADLETLGLENIGKKKKVNSVTIGLKNSANQGLSIGQSGGQTTVVYAAKAKDLVNPLASAPSTNPALITDLMQSVQPPSWDWYGRTLIRVSASPLPYTITGLSADVS